MTVMLENGRTWSLSQVVPANSRENEKACDDAFLNGVDAASNISGKIALTNPPQDLR